MWRAPTCGRSCALGTGTSEGEYFLCLADFVESSKFVTTSCAGIVIRKRLAPASILFVSLWICIGDGSTFEEIDTQLTGAFLSLDWIPITVTWAAGVGPSACTW